MEGAADASEPVAVGVGGGCPLVEEEGGGMEEEEESPPSVWTMAGSICIPSLLVVTSI